MSGWPDDARACSPPRRARLRRSGGRVAHARLCRRSGVTLPAFKLAFLWYLNALFNLNPLLALDGYHVLMDWLDIPNLRSRGLAFATARLRRRQVGWAGLSGEDRLYAMYGTAVVLWLVITLGLAVRLWKDRVEGLGAALWHDGIGGQAGIVLILLLLFAPIAGAVIRWAGIGGPGMVEDWRRGARADLPDRLRILVGTTLGSLDPARLTEIARRYVAVSAGRSDRAAAWGRRGGRVRRPRGGRHGRPDGRRPQAGASLAT